MKKNNLFILACAACAFLLSACSTELETSNNPNRVGDNEALIAVSLQFPHEDTPTGYAPGDLGDDVLPGVALSVEKEIRSIAFVAFTQGGTSVYLSKEPTLTENGFTKPLTPKDAANPGEYTAQFKIKSADFEGKTTIVAIANYSEHSLTFDAQTLTLDGLKKMLSDELRDEAGKNAIAYPLLMTVAYEEKITEGATVPIDFVMERIMARVDVVNNAYDKTTPANNFVLASAQLVSASTQGTMIAGQDVAPSGYIDLLPNGDVSEVAPANGQPVSPTNPAKQQLSPMYVYENSNADKADATKLSTTATYVLVKGTYKGKQYEKKIEFRTAKKNVNGVVEGGVIVPIVRNTRYVVEIYSSAEGEPVFEVKVTDWTEGEKLDVKLDFSEPVLDGFIAPTNGATWDVATKTLNINNASGTTDFEFIVRGFQDSNIRLDAGNPLAKTITVKRGLLSGYADGAADEEAPLSRTYTLTIPPYTGDRTLTKLIVYNTLYADAQTEITVKYAPVIIADLKTTQAGSVIDQGRRLISLNKAPDAAGTFTFFASCDVDVDTPIVNSKNTTADFYTFSKSEPETDVELIRTYGPGMRITMSYKALTDAAQLGEITVFEKGAHASTGTKMYVKCFRKPHFESYKFAPNAGNALAEGDMLYLAVNNGDHGTIDYTVYDDVVNNAITLAPTATYTTTATSPTWATTGLSVTDGDVLETVSESFQLVKRIVKVTLPKAIKNPAQATSFKVGIAGEPALQLTPVYLSGTKIAAADKAFRPVLVKTVWWSPISIGQTRISQLNDPSSACGNLFQWGRKQPFTWSPPEANGPVESAEAAGTNFIVTFLQPYDWLSVKNDRLWNSGTDANPVKTEQDPCPVGWRVPSATEVNNSITGNHTWAAGGASVSQNGLLTVSGSSGDNLYFPAAGHMHGSGGASTDQGTNGRLWVSSVNGISAQLVMFLSGATSVNQLFRSYGTPVRCVQE